MKRVITTNCKTREQLAAPYAHLTFNERMRLSNAVDLRDNHTIEDLGDGYIYIKPIDVTKTFGDARPQTN